MLAKGTRLRPRVPGSGSDSGSDSALAAVTALDIGIGLRTSASLAGVEFDLGPRLVPHTRAPLPDLLEGCREALRLFLAGAPRGDDFIRVALRRTGQAKCGGGSGRQA